MDKITEFCQPIADAIISGLEKVQADGCKWEMPWAAPKNRPYNWLTKEPYHGMNTLSWQPVSTTRAIVTRTG
jgi:antirestriction protein ArdC